MPRFDGTGPMGNGKLTGRGMGSCNPNNVQSTRPLRQGYGRGFRRGLGYVAPSKADLQEEKEVLQKRIDEINQRLQ